MLVQNRCINLQRSNVKQGYSFTLQRLGPRRARPCVPGLMMGLPGHLAKTNKVSARAKKFRDKLRRAQGGGTQKRMKNECPSHSVDSRLLLFPLDDWSRRQTEILCESISCRPIMNKRLEVILTECRETSISAEASKQFSLLGVKATKQECSLLLSLLSLSLVSYINMVWYDGFSARYRQKKTWRATASSNKPLSIFSSKEGEGNFPSFQVSQTWLNSDEWIARYR